MKRLMSVLLAVSIAFSVAFNIQAFAEEKSAETATIYVSNSEGNNDNDGTSAESPVATMSVAYQKLNELMKAAGKENDPEASGRIVLTGDVAFRTTSGPAPAGMDHHDYTIVVSGMNPDVQLQIKNNYNHLGPTKYENLTFVKLDGPTHSYIVANGYPIVMGENITTVPSTTGYNLSIIGAKLSGDYVGNSDITINSGTWRNIYAGNHQGTFTGNISLAINGGKIDTAIGTSYSGKHIGDTYITIKNAEVNRLSASNNSGSNKTEGNVFISVLEGATVHSDFKPGGASGIDGNINIRLSDCTVYGKLEMNCSGKKNILLEANEGKTLSLLGSDIDADSFFGGGNLVIKNGICMKTNEVLGTTSVSINGTPENGVPYIITPAETEDSAFEYVPQGGETFYSKIENGEKLWMISGGKDPEGIYITVPKDVKVTLFDKFGGSGTAIKESRTDYSEEEATYVFLAVEPGNYSYKMSGNGYYTVTKNLFYSEEKALKDLYITENPGKTGGRGFEQKSNIPYYTDEVMEKLLPSSKDLWPGYEDIFEIPCFINEKADHEMTTHEEMMDFIYSLDDSEDYMKIFVIEKTLSQKYDFPVVVFTKTDISSAETLEEAAKKINSDGKTTIHYQSLIHANEPAAGECALSMIKRLDGDYGTEILDSVNIYVIPRVNADGAYYFQRKNVTNGIDANRDHLRMKSRETEVLHYIYNLFMPEVVIDGHEYYNGKQGSVKGTLDDVQIGPGKNLYLNEKANGMLDEILELCFEETRELGIRAFYYDTASKYTSSTNYAIGREYYALRGSVSILIESNGLNAGLGWYERRIMSQYAVAESIIDYVAEHEKEIYELVEQQRTETAGKGGIYDEEDFVILQHGSSGAKIYASRPTWNLTDGTANNINATDYMYNKDVAMRTRVRPTAYVIPKGEERVEKAVAIIEKHGIAYYELPAGTSSMLRQYSGNGDSAELSEEEKVFFKNGAYVFPMNQVGGNLIAMLMEPDVTDTNGYNGTLVQSGILKAEDIYRSEKNLADGKLEIINTIADINLDGSVNVFDAYYARLVAAKLIKPTDEQLLVGDVDLDGRITAIDANIIRKFVAKIITSLPVIQ